MAKDLRKSHSKRTPRETVEQTMARVFKEWREAKAQRQRAIEAMLRAGGRG
jgi:hypothetical protein